MKNTLIGALLAASAFTSFTHAEILCTARFDAATPDIGFADESSEFYEDAQFTKPLESHNTSSHVWQVPANYGLPISPNSIVSRGENYEGQAFRLLGDKAVLKPGTKLYFSFTLSSKLYGGTRLAFARAGTEPHLRNANLQVIQVRTGAFRLLDDNETLADTEETYFEKNTFVVGCIDYDSGEFKLKVYRDDQLIDPNPTWDIESVAVPHNDYDRLAFRVAPNAHLGNIVIGQSWADVTGVE